MNYKEKVSLLPSLVSFNTSSVTSLYALSEKSLITLIIFVTLTSLVLYAELGKSILFWALSIILISSYRLYTLYLFKMHPEKYTLQQWHKKFTIFSLLTAIMVSTLGFYFLPSMGNYYQVFVVAAILGLTAGASISLSPEYRIAIPYISIIVLPLVVTFAIQDNPLHIIVPIMLVLFFISQIILILKNYSQEAKIKDLVEINEDLLKENKHFISDMVHQIKTPLSTIMLNTSLMEMKSDERTVGNIKQINSAISMLNNAFEDLSYVISNDTMKYTPVHIDLSEFIATRVDFFRDIIEHNHKKIRTAIPEKEMIVFINDTELERLIDNNITNAVKHSQENSTIAISLSKTSTEIMLQFISEGNAIGNVSKIFDKNYTENSHAKRSLGLGLYMVKNICEKNHIRYDVMSQDNINTFTYIFQI